MTHRNGKPAGKVSGGKGKVAPMDQRSYERSSAVYIRTNPDTHALLKKYAEEQGAPLNVCVIELATTHPAMLRFLRSLAVKGEAVA